MSKRCRLSLRAENGERSPICAPIILAFRRTSFARIKSL